MLVQGVDTSSYTGQFEVDFAQDPSKVLSFMNSGKKQDKKPEAKKTQLLTRSGSDPRFDNEEYLAKIEQQTLKGLNAQMEGVDFE